MLTGFDHVNIRTTNLDTMIAWYGDILGLHPGKRPPFRFPGAWLYLGDRAVVHLVAVDGTPQAAATSRWNILRFAPRG
ncbi:VOC family protein [Phaeobacter sp. J2-8]|uniref:VOC family protein n=1 Tax=Phaeobacter sp. J2-8 TaxID=2931394 RepID=UPI001FD19CC5|nr:VOC family protein [Phaeobacter sp. J2-8]MCJ7873093.1 VOC family protein [Phaeobacter sp. J2-8]